MGDREYDDKFYDISPKEGRRNQQALEPLLKELESLDLSKADPMVQTQAATARYMMRVFIDSDRYRRYERDLCAILDWYNLNHFTDVHNVRNPGDLDTLVIRLNELPSYVQQRIDNLRRAAKH